MNITYYVSGGFRWVLTIFKNNFIINYKYELLALFSIKSADPMNRPAIILSSRSFGPYFSEMSDLVERLQLIDASLLFNDPSTPFAGRGHIRRPYQTFIR